MKIKLLFAAACLAAFAMPLSAQAQGVPGGAAYGFNRGGQIAGPVGAVVGAAVGGVLGGVNGVLGVHPQNVDYREPVVHPIPRHHRPYKHHRRYRHHH